ncbi:MAG: hypothetical protein MZV64_48400 [Ignavibacteriales bacterium]|nr:hypothetical protein [Ignavibacteriales bacterium]
MAFRTAAATFRLSLRVKVIGFLIDVFSGIAGIQSLKGMPVVGCGNDYRIDVLTVEDGPVILVGNHFSLNVFGLIVLFHLLFETLPLNPIYIGPGNDLNPGMREKLPIRLLACLTQSDHPDPDRIVGTCRSEALQQRHGGKTCCPGHTGLNKPAS